MNSVFVLCVGMMGAMAPAGSEAGSQPVQVAQAGYGILPGGCYQPAYRSPVVQNYPSGNSNCPGGWCGPMGTANCPNGNCSPAGNNCGCLSGYCPQHGVYGSQGTRFNAAQPGRFSSATYPPPRTTHSLPRTYEGNWSNASRLVSTSRGQNPASPFFD
jgi:hypothetical protein